ncbi:DUF1800 domain-containing protein [Labilibacter marinus]|uniref:DUF1800 domain-containing protein n=1 Tax=Labilibacter marinus TaxID=1477105 RepID=UPI00082B6AE1|nr:DUF1800 domain-containing protein [Labilibacter marinus]
MELKEYCHLLKRATIAVKPEQLNKLPSNRKSALDNIFKKASTVKPLNIEHQKWNNVVYKDLSAQQRKQLNKYNREKLIEYNKAWFARMCDEADNLRERMVLFWANHFVVMSKSIAPAESFNNSLRNHALGNFKELTIAVAKEAAMIQYLDNNKNKKQAPNENFARELMELFTLGRDVLYTEKDIKEAAKAFTGWRSNREGDFIFAQRQHDDSEKSFLGKQGNFKGEDIIDIILENKECAHFICKEVYREFVNENINTRHVNELTDVFYQTYDIEKLMRYLFMQDWFYDEVNMANKVKSPIELLVSIHQLFPFEMENEKQFLYFQRSLGQILLYPPNVAGWPGGLNWIDSNTLMLRLRLPSLIVNKGMIDTQASEEQVSMMQKRKVNNKLKINVDESQLSALKKMDTIKLEILLFGKTPHAEVKALFQDKNQKERIVKMLSVPDFQMC